VERLVTWATDGRERADDPQEEGSVLLLTIGYLVLAIVAIFVCVCATDLYIAQKRLDALADAAALAGADGFTVIVEADGVHSDLTDAGVAAQAQPLVADASFEAAVVSARAPGGDAARVTLSAAWHPPLVSVFVPDGVRLEATATSRTALR
jgi:uncharacterized membrane protein